MGEPYFVVRIETDSNNVVIGRKEELGCTVLTGDDLNWLTDEMPDGSPIRPGETLKCEVQIRYNSRSAPATVRVMDNEIAVEFDTPQFGVAPGQAVVCYFGQQVLGGGWIKASGSVS